MRLDLDKTILPAVPLIITSVKASGPPANYSCGQIDYFYP